MVFKKLNVFLYIKFDQTLDILQYKSDYFYSKLSANCTASAYATSQRMTTIRQRRLDDQLRSKAKSSALTQTGKIKNEYFSFCLHNAVMRFFYLRFLDILVQTFQNI